MSKLSAPLKALINSPHSKPDPIAAPKHIRAVYDAIAKEATAQNVGLPAWLTLSTATTMTMNSPESMLELHSLAESKSGGDQQRSVYAAELMREVGLKCISFNGIPRTINVLGSFYNGLPAHVRSALSTTPTRHITPENLRSSQERGRALWSSVYIPFDSKLLQKLAQSHPDLPVHIIESHYTGLLSDPLPASQAVAKVGRVLTSLTAIATLRSQTGVGPQVLSHVFGLRKAVDGGDYKAEGEACVEGTEWLATEDGSTWILGAVDRIVEAIGGSPGGTSFAPGMKAKL